MALVDFVVVPGAEYACGCDVMQHEDSRAYEGLELYI